MDIHNPIPRVNFRNEEIRMISDDCRLPAERTRWTCDPDLFDFETTDQLPDLEDAIGQKRALRSIDFGLGMEETGFNHYIAGETGTGRASTIRSILKKRARSEAQPNDWVYVFNFKDHDSAVSLSLPAGR